MGLKSVVGADKSSVTRHGRQQQRRVTRGSQDRGRPEAGPDMEGIKKSLESWEDYIPGIRSRMDLENRDGDDLTSGDHLESVKRDSDSPPDEGAGTGEVKDEAIKDLGESLGLNNWQT